MYDATARDVYLTRARIRVSVCAGATFIFGRVNSRGFMILYTHTHSDNTGARARGWLSAIPRGFNRNANSVLHAAREQ